MATMESPKAIEIPRTPRTPSTPPESAADPHPKNVRTKVPMNSATYFFICIPPLRCVLLNMSVIKFVWQGMNHSYTCLVSKDIVAAHSQKEKQVNKNWIFITEICERIRLFPVLRSCRKNGKIRGRNVSNQKEDYHE